MSLSLAGCDGAPPPPPPAPPAAPGAWTPTGEAVAEGGGVKIDKEMLEAVERRIPPDQLARMKGGPQYDQFLERLVVGEVLYKKAIEEGVHHKPKVKVTVAMAMHELLAGEFVRQVGQKAVTEDAVKAFYEERKVQYARPAVRANHILVKEQDLARDLVRQLRGGADFAALAGQHSLDPGSKQQGGDLGWFQKGKMIPEVAEVAFAAKKGDISEPIETRYGFHVIQVTDRRDTTPLEDVREEIEMAIEQQAVEAYMSELRNSIEVKTHKEAL